MLDWIVRLIGGLFSRQPGESREDFKAVTAAYNGLMEQFQLIGVEMRQEVEQLRREVASISAALDAEKQAHRECRKQLDHHEKTIRKQDSQIRQQRIEIDGNKQQIESLQQQINDITHRLTNG